MHIQNFNWEKYLIPRNEGFEELLKPLIILILGGGIEYDVSGGAEYEDDTFSTSPYFLGSCHCPMKGYMRDFNRSVIHEDECFHMAYNEVQREYKELKKEIGNNLQLKINKVDMEKLICKEHKIKYIPSKIKDICTCSYKDQFTEVLTKMFHDEDCPCVRPNFHYKPTDLKIYWHKLFFRDSFANQEISLDDFKDITLKCMSSVHENK